jgi:hypothetical protein
LSAQKKSTTCRSSKRTYENRCLALKSDLSFVLGGITIRAVQPLKRYTLNCTDRCLALQLLLDNERLMGLMECRPLIWLIRGHFTPEILLNFDNAYIGLFPSYILLYALKITYHGAVRDSRNTAYLEQPNYSYENTQVIESIPAFMRIYRVLGCSENHELEFLIGGKCLELIQPQYRMIVNAVDRIASTR